MINKKGVLGLDTVKAVIVILLILAVTVIALFLSISSLDPAIGNEGSITNTSTFTLVDGAGANTGVFPTGLNLPILTNLIVWNGTNETAGYMLLNSGNYTVSLSSGNIIATALSEYNNSLVNVTFDYTDSTERQTDFINENITNGTATFFTNIPTVFTILGAVIIILAVTLILFAVNRFSTGGSGLSSGGSSGSSSAESRL